DLRIDRAILRNAVEEISPAALHRLRLVEARLQRMPRDLGNDRVDATVDRGRDELDPAAVRRADHSHARVALAVELHAWLLRDPVDKSRDVATLEVGAVGLDGPARVPEAPWVPGEHVVTGRVERANAEIAEQAVTRTG